MANLRNANGVVVINSAEAQADINNLRRARTALENARRDLISEQSRLNPNWEGSAKVGFDIVHRELLRGIDSTIASISASMRAISEVVALYERTDRAFAAAIRAEGGQRL